MTEPVFDLLIVGGGINGAGIAADAAGRGLKVLLAEMDDLASGTSSASSKLIHGGLRYLEHYEFRLVRDSLVEREVLLAKAPHIVWPLRFVLPYVEGGRPWVMLRAGLFLYDNLGQRTTIPSSYALNLRRDPAGRAVRPELTEGFAYWDCWVDDARLVVLNARAAADRGAEIKTRTRVSAIAVRDGLWDVTLSEPDDAARHVRARALVNAAGPWSDAVSALMDGGRVRRSAPPLRLVKGSHIVVPRLGDTDDAYLCQSPDGRVVFALPFERRFTLIGTTDVEFSGDPSGAAITAEEEDYLIQLAGQFFAAPIARSGIVWSFAGVRALYDDETADPSAVTRDYRLELTAAEGWPPLLTVLSGKITTYRRLAEAALEKLSPYFPSMGPPWTATAPLPGGEVGERGFDAFVGDLCRRRGGFDPGYLRRLARRYGTGVDELLGDATQAADLGAQIGAGLTEREVCYLKGDEWAKTPDDVLWRRTKCGLNMGSSERSAAAEAIARLL